MLHFVWNNTSQFHKMTKLTLVLGFMALFSLLISLRSTKLISIPICVAATREKYL